MRRLTSWLLLPALLLAFGCKTQEDTVGGLVRPKKIESAISLSPSTTEIMTTLGNFSVLKGRTASCNWPESSVKRVPIVASVKPDFEKIATIKPDLIVYDASTYNKEDIEKIKQLGAQTFEMTGDTIDDYIDQLYKLASIVGIETGTADYIAKVQSAEAAAQGNPITPTPKVAVMMAGWGGAEHFIAGSKSFTADAMRASGGQVVGPESNKFEKLSPEFLVTQNPDIIVIGVPAKDKPTANKRVEAIIGDPRLKTVSAIAKRKIIAFDEDILVRRGERVDKFIDNMHDALSNMVSGK